MSRLDKKQHREHIVGTSRDAAVRLYAFANTRPGYHIVFSPERPIIVLKTKKGTTKQHPCNQWAPLASYVFSKQPNTTHALYLIDTTALPESMEKEEHITPNVGPVVKRLSNVVAKLNPHNATMVAAGVSCLVSFKYAVMGEKALGHMDRLVRRLILVCPSSIQPFQMIIRATSRKSFTGEYPRPELVLLLSDASQVQCWQEWLQDPSMASFLDSWSISTNLNPSLFAAVVREAGVGTDGTTVNLDTHFDVPHVFRIDFILSKATKKVEQHITLSPLTSSGCDDDDNNDNDDDNKDKGRGSGNDISVTPSEEEDEEEEDDDSWNRAKKPEETKGEECCLKNCSRGEETNQVFGLTALHHLKQSVRVIVEGLIMDVSGGILGTTQGRVQVHRLHEAAKACDNAIGRLKLTRGMAVRLESCLQRDEDGRTSLEVLKVKQLTKTQERRSMTVCTMREVPTYNVSAVSHAYGALLVRGRKCVLVRSLNGDFDGMRLPVLLHDNTEETSMECAERALCEWCDISSDNFYIPNYFSPVCYYERKNKDGICVCTTIYLALAVTPPSGGVDDATEDDISPGEPYDWFGYARATSLLQTEVEKEALQDLKRSVCRAYDAGIYVPLKGFGVFGDILQDTTNSFSATPSLEGLEMTVMCAPGDVECRALQVVREQMTDCIVSVNESTPRVDIEQAAIATLSRGGSSIVLCLSNGLELNTFFEEELVYWSQRGVRPRVVTLLFPGVSEMIVQQADNGTACADFLCTVTFSDAILTVEASVDRLTSPTWGLLRLARHLNKDLELFSGFNVRHPIIIPLEVPTLPIEAGLHEITIRREGRPIVVARLEPLLEPGGLQACYHDSTLLWAQGEVWLASRSRAKRTLTLDVCSRCFTLEEGDSEEDDAPVRENIIMLHVWATPAVCTKLESAVGLVLDGILRGNSATLAVDGACSDEAPE